MFSLLLPPRQNAQLQTLSCWIFAVAGTFGLWLVVASFSILWGYNFQPKIAVLYAGLVALLSGLMVKGLEWKKSKKDFPLILLFRPQSTEA